MSQLPVPYVPPLPVRVTRPAPWLPIPPAPLAGWETLLGVVVASLATAAVITVIAVHSW